MPRKKQNYQYSDNNKKTASKVVDKTLKKYTPDKYRDSLKAMINDQINAMESPSFIADTVINLINYETKYLYTDMKIPDSTLVTLKQKLTNALEGIEW